MAIKLLPKSYPYLAGLVVAVCAIVALIAIPINLNDYLPGSLFPGCEPPIREAGAVHFCSASYTLTALLLLHVIVATLSAIIVLQAFGKRITFLRFVGLFIVSFCMTIAFSLVVVSVRSTIDSERREQQKQYRIDNYKFSLFAPSFMPSGYKLFGGDDNYDGGGSYSLMYFVDDNDSPQITIKYQAPGEDFKPPEMCPVGTKVECRNIGVSSFGETVWYSADHAEMGFQQVYYLTKIDNTLVVLSAHVRNADDLSPETVLRIINSLDKNTADELRQL